MSTERRYSLLRHQHTIADLQDWGLFGTSGDWWGKLPRVLDDGVMEIGKYIDFHETDADTDDYDFRITSSGGWLVGSGGLNMGRSIFAGATNVLPALGYHNESTALSLVYSGDANYGLAAGVLGTGVAWIQSMRADSSATAYGLQLQPRGGGVLIDPSVGAYLQGGAVASNWNEGAISSDNALTFMRASNTMTNSPLNYDNANGQITYNYHSGGYCRQFGFVDTDYGLYTRYQTNNTWGSWHRIPMYSGATGYLDVNTADTWSSSGWYRTIRCAAAADSNAIMLYGNGKHWGIGNSGGNLYVMHTTSDSSAAPGMTYPLYHDGTYWNVTSSVIGSGHFSIPTGYGYYLNGMGGTKYMASANTYGSLRIGGATNGYSGLEDDTSGLHFIWDASKNGGVLHAGVRWMLYYYYGHDCWGFGGTSTSASYRIYVTGSAYASGTWTASDERKKRDIKTIPYALDRVCAMRGVEYRWRPEADVGQDPEPYHVGLIAQEVEKVVPEAVHYAADADSYAVDYSGLVGLLIQAVKELKEKVDVLETKRSR